MKKLVWLTLLMLAVPAVATPIDPVRPVTIPEKKSAYREIGSQLAFKEFADLDIQSDLGVSVYDTEGLWYVLKTRDGKNLGMLMGSWAAIHEAERSLGEHGGREEHTRTEVDGSPKTD